MILEQTNYLDKTIGIYVGELVEYDMREGGWSIIQKEHLLPDYIMKSFRKMTKEERHKAIGNLAHSHGRQFKDVPRLLIDKFKDYRLLFGELNDLTDDDIFYVRKDAICTKKFCYETKIDKYIEFREKKRWDCYVRIEPEFKDDKPTKPSPLEFYWTSATNGVDVKGLGDREGTVLPLHENGILKVVKEFMNRLYLMEYDDALKYIVSVMNAYKHGWGIKKGCNSPQDIYRRFDGESKYRILYDGSVMDVDEIGEDIIGTCDKAYNYRNILLPMFNLVVK